MTLVIEPNAAKQTPTIQELSEALPQMPNDLTNIIHEFIGNPFVFTMKISNSNMRVNFRKTLATRNKYIIDWGTDSKDTYSSNYDENNTKKYKYNKTGVYIIHIYGDISKILFNCDQRLQEVSQWGDFNLLSYSMIFYGCQKLVVTARDNPSFKHATSANNMFHICSNLTGDFSNWDISNISDLSHMFESCELFTSDLSRWNVSKVTNMTSLFAGCKVFNSDLSNWNISNVNDTTYMFSGCESFTSDLSRWNTSNIKSMACMFSNCKRFNSNLSRWNTSQVSDMRNMFYRCESFTSDLSKWDTWLVTDMRHMFKYCNSFNSDLREWDLSNITKICPKCNAGLSCTK